MRVAGALQGFTRRRVTGSHGFTSHFIACYKITGGHTSLISHQTSRSHAISFIQQGSPTAVMYIVHQGPQSFGRANKLTSSKMRKLKNWEAYKLAN